MNSQSKTIVFADIASSTRLYQTLGNERAKETIDTCMDILSRTILKFDGLIVKTIGDEVMSIFDKPDNAIMAAIEMNVEIEKRFKSFNLESFPLNIYTGIHCGHVIEDKGDFFGDAVNIAARIVRLAKQRQIITTSDTFQELEPCTQNDLRSIGKVRLKGVTEEVGVYEVIWEHEEMTLIVNTLELPRRIERMLDVKYGDQVYHIGKQNPSLSVGRQDFNDIIIDQNFISRTHAVIEYRKNSFILVDKSSNGTFIEFSEGNIVKVLKDEIPLNEEGKISAGDETFEITELIRYKERK